MRSWWRKSSKDVKRKSSKYVKQKSSRECIFGSLHRTCIRPGSPRRRRSDISSDRKTQSSEDSRSPSPSKQVSRCLSFGERPQAQPLPLPGCEFSSINRAGPENVASTEPSLDRGLRTSVLLPLPKPERVKSGRVIDGEGDLATGSNSSDSSSDTDDPSDSRLLSPQASDCENAIISATTNPSAEKQKDQFPFVIRKTTREDMKPANNVLMSRTPASPKQRPLNSHLTYLQMPHQSTFLTAPDSSMSSPSRSPMRVVGHEPLTSTGFSLGKPYADVSGSGHCSSPGSGYNSGHNSVAGDTSFQILWPQSRCSPECSPLTSPRMTSPGPCSRMHSGAVTPLHPRVGGLSTESPTSRLDDGKQQSHRLPLPPVTISNPSSFNPAPYSTGTSPRISRSPGRADNPSNPGARWKKGRLLGRGTFGHVYLGFSSETGEMCAMKEVTLFANDAKSRECAQQLGQEIALLSRLHHPNIVQYYGSETMDDKLYIYLEYVSGGSIYKILQDYGQLGEAAIRSYTRQILSGLAYLHTKNTIHRDIKGANILVEPNGRVKLADFGMAKHITGPSCPLSFKGSPYWMAPEVIRNSNGCNLAVDIWSLGCTVLEMATTKPPWSQYEGVAALFKIGNSRELPVIPDHLSDEGKDFVRQCLQRNPFNRPTAAQLLEHPFVKNVALLERPFLGTEHTHAMPAMTHAVRMLGLGHSKTLPCLNSLGAVHHSKSSTSDPRFSDAYTARNISCPISPVRIPLPQPLSPKNVSGRLSPSSASSPQATSGASTPLRIGNRALTSCHRKIFVNEGTAMVSRSRTTSHLNANDREEHKPDIFRGIVQAHLFMEKRERSCKLGSKIELPVIGDQKEQVYNSPLILADRVSRQLLRNPVRLNPVLDLNPNSPIPRRTNGN